MLQTAFATITLLSLISLNTIGAVPVEAQKTQIAERIISLNHRVEGSALNEVYKDNILLNLAYMRGIVSKNAPINWEEVRKSFNYEFELQPGERFVFHEAVKAEYLAGTVKTMNSHFSGDEGYKSDGALFGMGVCHLASVINWAAKDAQLESIAPTNHDFYVINQVPREFGVAIYYSPDSISASELQNLYIKNTFDKNITFRFEYNGDNLSIKVLKVS